MTELDGVQLDGPVTKKAKLDFGGEAQVLTAGEVTRWLRIPKSTPYELCQEGQVPETKIGRHWRFDRNTVEDWFKSS